MKRFLFLVSTALLISCSTNKNTVNINRDGYIADGYDVTEYFNDNAIKGNSLYISKFNGAMYKFLSIENKNKFDANPKKYQPQYGGYCAYAVGVNASKVSINPKSYLVDNNKLYLFYDNVLVDTKQKWLDNNPQKLSQKANENWIKIHNPEAINNN